MLWDVEGVQRENRPKIEALRRVRQLDGCEETLSSPISRCNLMLKQVKKKLHQTREQGQNSMNFSKWISEIHLQIETNTFPWSKPCDWSSKQSKSGRPPPIKMALIRPKSTISDKNKYCYMFMMQLRCYWYSFLIETGINSRNMGLGSWRFMDVHELKTPHF